MAGGRRSKSSGKSQERELTESDQDSLSMDLVKDLLQIQESSIKSMFTAVFDSTNKRIDGLIKDVQDLKTSLELSQAEIAELKTVTNKERLTNIKTNIQELLDKTDDLENRSRRNNLCFDGITETPGSESWEKSEENVRKVLKDQLKLDDEDIIIERAHRVGKRKPGKCRSIVAKFLSYKDREQVFKSKRKLKGTKITVREDFSDKVNKKRQELLPKMHEARKEGKTAYLSFDKLIIRDQPRYIDYNDGDFAYNPNSRAHYVTSPPFIPNPMFISQPVMVAASQVQVPPPSNEQESDPTYNT